MDGTKLEGKPDPMCQGDFQALGPQHTSQPDATGDGFDKPEGSRLSRPVEAPMNQADQAMQRLIDENGTR